MAWDFLWSTLASGSVAAVLLGVAAYLGRSQLAHWLSVDLERIKAEHQRALEAYKTDLIARSERTKAEQEVRKSMALRVAERQFNALELLMRTTHSLSIQALLLLHFHQAGTREADVAAARDALSASDAALADALIFLSDQESAGVFDLHREVNRCIGVALRLDAPMEASAFKRHTDAVNPLQHTVNAMLRGRIEAMLAMA